MVDKGLIMPGRGLEFFAGSIWCLADTICSGAGTPATAQHRKEATVGRVARLRPWEVRFSPLRYTGQVFLSHSTRSTHSSCPVFARISSTPEMRTPKASFLTLEGTRITPARSEEHTSELQSRQYLVCRLLLEKKK